ncbi:MAG: uroporphyrinogen-III C-methyltransferase [Alcaligenaceae bacterium]
MTEPTSPSPSSTQAKQAEPATPANSPAPEYTSRLRRKNTGLSWSVVLMLVFFLIALVIGTGAWFAQKRFDTAGREVATQVQGFTAQLIETKREAKLALGLVEAQAKLIVDLQQSLAESKSQFEGLEEAWASFNKGMEDSMLANDIDRLVTLASQQLRLASNVNNAVMALETALSTLVRADRPRFAAVQRAISTDLDRLRSVPLIDVSALSVRLEALANLIGRAPLLVPDAAVPKVAAITPPATSVNSVQAGAAPASRVSATEAAQPVTAPAVAAEDLTEQAWLAVAWRKTVLWSKAVAVFVAKELASVVSIQRVTDASALLMSPEQGSQLRANLRTRVLTAQMALLMHQPSVWRAEIASIEASLTARYDPKAVDTVAALRLVRELASVPVAAALPDMSDSIAALEAVRLQEPNNKSEN